MPRTRLPAIGEPDPVERLLAVVMLKAQANARGVIAHNENSKALFQTWEMRGWTKSYVDDQGERWYHLTFEGKATLIDRRPAPAVPS
jgi:hypothetical protein